MKLMKKINGMEYEKIRILLKSRNKEKNDGNKISISDSFTNLCYCY